MCFCPSDYGAADFQAEYVRKSRKDRRCCECNCAIKPGDRYVHLVIKWEGEIASNDMCVDCRAWADAFVEAQFRVCGCGGWPMRALWDEIREFCREHLGYDPDALDDEAA